MNIAIVFLCILQSLVDMRVGDITLPQAVAKAGGHLTLDISPNVDYFHTSLESLVRESDVIVLARRRLEPFVTLSSDERSVITIHEMQVQEQVKGISVSHIIVETPGGYLTIPSIGTVDVVNGPIIETNRSYVLFLKHYGSRYMPLGFYWEGVQPVAKIDNGYDKAFVSHLFTRVRKLVRIIP